MVSLILGHPQIKAWHTNEYLTGGSLIKDLTRHIPENNKGNDTKAWTATASKGVNKTALSFVLIHLPRKELKVMFGRIPRQIQTSMSGFRI